MSTICEETEGISQGTCRLIDQHPLPSALVAFGAGLGLGLLAAVILPPASRQRDAAIGRQVLDTLSNILPDSFKKRIS